MKPVVDVIESLSMWTGKAFAWCIVILTFATCYEVFVRYVLNTPTTWAFDMSVQMYGALFIMAGAYALAQQAHVRADVFYRFFPTRIQAGLDLVLYVIFLAPGMFAFIYYGAGFAIDSWFYKEVSWSSPARIQIYFFKTLIPVAGVLILLQGVAECMRCIVCLKTGEWPQRKRDVEELAVNLTQEQSNTTPDQSGSSLHS